MKIEWPDPDDDLSDEKLLQFLGEEIPSLFTEIRNEKDFDLRQEIRERIADTPIEDKQWMVKQFKKISLLLLAEISKSSSDLITMLVDVIGDLEEYQES
jgi:hypothetical protein